MESLAERPVTELKGVGPKQAEKLAALGLNTLQDLLFHLPLRYQDRTRISPIGTLRHGDQVVIEGEVQLTEVKFGRRRSLLSRISDGTGSITLRFFHFSKAQQQGLARGARIRCFGEARRGAATLEMVHPEYRLVGDEAAAVEESLTPIYPAGDGIQQPTLRRLTDQVLALLQRTPGLLPDLLPPELIPDLPSLHDSLLLLHRPPPDVSLEALREGQHPAQQRLVFEELLAHHLSLRKLRHQAQQHEAPPLVGDGGLRERFTAALPFELTGAQRRVVAECAADMGEATPMQRLVQGDVGSGKTAVAALAVLQAVEAGFQAAVMAPTELLAEQHYRNFSAWLEPLGLEAVWLSGRLKGKARNEALAAIASGAALVVGTHALFQDEVAFDELGLVVVDEQHRFGVHQRLALREKGAAGGRYPHQLIMTATPIPRTLAMTAYADLDVSVIDELPPGRTPVETVVLPEDRRAKVIERVRHACASESRQAYWVCTLIEESESLQASAAEDTAAELAAALPELRVGLVHGRLKPEEKEAVMAAFKAGELQLLVATTVIEVGVDVPNASLMIIENAERLGLAQLHQLRGRVGRGAARSSCVLLYHGNLSGNARERLGIMRESNDGFVIARKDLELRGPGEVLGTRQTGMLQLRIADLQRDEALLAPVAEAAARLLAREPALGDALIRRWLGVKERYGAV